MQMQTQHGPAEVEAEAEVEVEAAAGARVEAREASLTYLDVPGVLSCTFARKSMSSCVPWIE